MTERSPANLVARLLGRYDLDVSDGGGPLNGRSTFTRQFDVVPIQREAAERIRWLERRVELLERMIAGHANGFVPMMEALRAEADVIRSRNITGREEERRS